jgi:hypothetical protein
MHDVVRAVLCQTSDELSSVPPWPTIVRASEYSRSQPLYFLIVGPPLIVVYEKIHCKSLAINVTEDMHEPCFYPATLSASQYVQNSFHSRR